MSGPLVCVLMATFNGGRFLQDQLQSLAGQSHQNWHLFVSDDRSEDATLAILGTFQRQIGKAKVTILTGPGGGASANFGALVEASAGVGGAIAFCDQDDIWLPKKLERAVAALSEVSGPALYACRSEIIDRDGARIGDSRAPRRTLGLSHALAENTLPGHSMVLNPAAAAVLRAAGPVTGFHDWWAYQVIAAAGGQIVFDRRRSVKYRQHDGNLVGSGQRPGAALRRIGRVLGGDYGRAVRMQAEALLASDAPGRSERIRIAALLSLRQLPFWRRVQSIGRIGIYRQNRAEDAVLKVLMLAGRI